MTTKKRNDGMCDKVSRLKRRCVRRCLCESCSARLDSWASRDVIIIWMLSEFVLSLWIGGLLSVYQLVLHWKTFAIIFGVRAASSFLGGISTGLRWVNTMWIYLALLLVSIVMTSVVLQPLSFHVGRCKTPEGGCQQYARYMYGTGPVPKESFKADACNQCLTLYSFHTTPKYQCDHEFSTASTGRIPVPGGSGSYFSAAPVAPVQSTVSSSPASSFAAVAAWKIALGEYDPHLRASLQASLRVSNEGESRAASRSSRAQALSDAVRAVAGGSEGESSSLVALASRGKDRAGRSRVLQAEAAMAVAGVLEKDCVSSDNVDPSNAPVVSSPQRAEQEGSFQSVSEDLSTWHTADKCELVVGISILIVCFLNLVSLLMACIVFKFAGNRCADYCFCETQFVAYDSESEDSSSDGGPEGDDQWATHSIKSSKEDSTGKANSDAQAGAGVGSTASP